MVRRIEIVLVLIAIVLLTLFSASFADPSTNISQYDYQNAFYGRDILTESSASNAAFDSSVSNYDSHFWGVPDISHP